MYEREMPMLERLRRLTPFARGTGAVAIIVFSFAVTTDSVVHGGFAMGDFKAFYCSARVLLEHEDPYATAPMQRCQSAPAPRPLLVTKPGEVLPAPLPGYAIAAFTPLGALPFPVACVLWIVVLLAATIAAIVLFARLGVADPWTIAVALTILVGAASFTVGELPPIALLGVALGAWGAKKGRLWAVGAAVILTSFEPQVGAAVVLALVVLQRRFILPVIAALAVLAMVSLAAVGIPGNLEYVRSVVPAHLLSELPSVLQYSLSWALYQAGVTANTAVFLGRLSWIVMLAVTVWFARTRFARERPEVAVLAAPAFAIVAGPFLHFDHMALAIPAALWVAPRVAAPLWLRIAMVVTLALPLLHIFSHEPELVLIPVMACWLGASVSGRFDGGLRTALVAICVTIAVMVISVIGGTGAHPVAPARILSPELAQGPWSQYVAAHLAMTGWTLWFVKAPTWFGIVANAGLQIACARQR
jgi:hypothetical protein